MNSAIAVMDFTYHVDKFEEEVFNRLRDYLNEKCKKYCFQLEKGSLTDKLHYQGRFSLKIKKRIVELKSPFNWHLSPTSDGNRANNFYVSKDDTRVMGPWTETNFLYKYIPKQFRGKLDTLYPFQKKIIEVSKIFNDREINYIYCKDGNKGKSTIAHLCRLHLDGLVLPVVNDSEKLIQSCCNMLMGKNIRNSIPIFIDLPRALQDKKRLYGLYIAIEQIKGGYVYDMRNKWKEWDFDSPTIWVIANQLPMANNLSLDRWKIWEIVNNELVTYIED